METNNIPSLDGEEWRDIPGYEGKYMVSSFGRVYSHKTHILLKYGIVSGYNYVNIGKRGKRGTIAVHRLVASAFLGLDLEPKFDHTYSFCVCHKNDIRDDNRLENLFLGTHKENAYDMIKKGRHRCLSGENHPCFGKRGYDNVKAKQVIQKDKNGLFIKEWGSMKLAGIGTGIERTNISKCCQGKGHTAGGFIWEYKN